MAYFVIGVVGIIIIAIIALFIHHAFTHDGKFFDPEDFKSAFSGLFSSHEGIIVLLSVVAIGLIL